MVLVLVRMNLSQSLQKSDQLTPKNVIVFVIVIVIVNVFLNWSIYVDLNTQIERPIFR